MDFIYKYSQEQEDFRSEVSSWLDQNIPAEMRAPVDRTELTEKQYRFWRDMHKTLAEKGWLFPTYPKEYGGGGLTGEQETILQEEFQKARVVASFTNGLVFPTLLVWGNEQQKEALLKPLLSADKIAFQNFSEPNAGSDLASLQSKASRDGDDWLITGQKTWISGMGEPDYLFGPMLTDPDAPRHRNLGYFMVPFPSEGLTMERMDLLSGNDQSVFFFDEVRVPGDHLIGGENQGWQVTQTTLEVEHGGRGQAVPIDEAMENLLDFVKKTDREGAPLGDDPLIQQTAMSAYIDSHVHGLLNLRNYAMYGARQEMTYEGSQTSMFGKVYRIENADRSRDIMGMYSLCGVSEPRAPFSGQPEVYQRSSLVGAHPAGTIEIQKVIIARRIGISRTRERAAATPSTAGV
jgi:alkylation response protein AidB-like acyl-CoA dehydrogenase